MDRSVCSFFSTVINYMDRQNLSILARTIQNDLQDHRHSVQLRRAGLPACLYDDLHHSRRLDDWLGTRVSMALFVAWWSIADMLTA